MTTQRIVLFALLSTSFVAANAQNNQAKEAEKTEVWQPVPKLVTPATEIGKAPSDAIMLFNGDNLNQWVSSRDTTKAAEWTVNGDVFMVKKGTGNIQTKQSFTDYQLHVEFRVPSHITGTSQGRGNSGIFLAGWGRGDGGYEIQVMDSYKNPTYVNGMAGSIYKQHIPLANVNRPPGEWNIYDIIWTAPRFNTNGSLKSPARVTAFINGVLVQNNVEVKGETRWIGQPEYPKAGHGPLPIKLQDHGDPSEPVSFKNIWIRPL